MKVKRGANGKVLGWFGLVFWRACYQLDERSMPDDAQMLLQFGLWRISVFQIYIDIYTHTHTFLQLPLMHPCTRFLKTEFNNTFKLK